MSDISSYVFPFTTCERPTLSSWVAQPASVVANAVIIGILGGMEIVAQTWAVKRVLLALIVFEIVHLTSHAWHISAPIQTMLIHVMARVVAGMLWWAIWIFVPSIPRRAHIMALGLLK